MLAWVSLRLTDSENNEISLLGRGDLKWVAANTYQGCRVTEYFGKTTYTRCQRLEISSNLSRGADVVPCWPTYR